MTKEQEPFMQLHSIKMIWPQSAWYNKIMKLNEIPDDY